VAASSARTFESASFLSFAERLQQLIDGFILQATKFVAKSKLEETVQQWLGRRNLDPDEPGSELLIAQALLYALELVTFTPSFSGNTAIDRFARQHKSIGTDDVAALEALKRASFRVLRIKSIGDDGWVQVEDLASGTILSVLDRDIPVGAIGVAVAVRLCPLPSGRFVSAGLLTPLDETALEVALGFARPGKGLANPQRCAAAVYRHIVRNGVLRVPGLNYWPELEEGNTDVDPEDSELDLLAQAWAALSNGVEPDFAELTHAARLLTSLQNLILALVGSLEARRDGRGRLADAFARLASIQMETMQRRSIAGSRGYETPLDQIAEAIDHGVARNLLTPDVRRLYDDLVRLLLANTGGRAKVGDEDLARVVQRIQALRAKTVDQGCTEQEALASAKKVAELLDRYGLSLSEIELRHQVCEGIGIDTERRRREAFDSCVPSVAAFCDCKVWTETTPSKSIRYVFFGLPADVGAAHYLYDLIEVTFATETKQFKLGEIYGEMQADQRRKAVKSFQIGLSNGIVNKLNLMKAERDAANKTSSGRDIVPLKASVIEDELAKLGLSFAAKSQARRKHVLVDAYEAGEVAGHRFEVRPGIETADASQ
jgi:hypothetical protein